MKKRPSAVFDHLVLCHSYLTPSTLESTDSKIKIVKRLQKSIFLNKSIINPRVANSVNNLF